jgi:hypothetical protein
MTELGRPTTYTPEIGAKVCEVFAESEYGLRKTLKDHPELPAYGTVQGWRRKHQDFEMIFAQAKEQQLHNMAEDIVDIAHDETIEPNARRLMVDTRKWLLSKLMHKTYGDKLDVTSGGETLNTGNAMLVDQRVQSIIMQAQARRAGHELPELDANALKLLD